MPLAESLSAFFNVAEHATQGVLDNVPVLGIHDNGYTQLMGGMASLEPTYTLASAAAARAGQASILRIVDGPTYRVRSVQPDGTGITTLVLERQ